MRITHPLWPAVREFSRRLLREDGLVLTVGVHQTERVNQLLLAMGDRQPERLTFPEVVVHPTKTLTLQVRRHGKLTLWATCSDVEPGPSVLWLPMDADDALDSVFHASHDLLQAGYPGCIGCVGSVDETAWDEGAHRQRWVDLIMKGDSSPVS
jgi:hypothetical protein